MSKSTKPVVMCFSGLDPSGGAGIQADIETLASIGCHCAPIITLLTAQNTIDIQDTRPVPGDFIAQQALTVLQDMPVSAFKIGLLGNLDSINSIFNVVSRYPDIPLIWDPVITSGGGTTLLTQQLMQTALKKLGPLTDVITPNSSEARLLFQSSASLAECAQYLMQQGCHYVLITGTHEDTPRVLNRLWGDGQALLNCQWDRLPETYHGSGCTLASALAGYLTKGLDVLSAAREAQAFTWKALRNGYQLGKGQRLPQRFFGSSSHESANSP